MSTRELLDVCHQFEMQREKLRQERARTRAIEARARAAERQANRASLPQRLDALRRLEVNRFRAELGLPPK